VKREERVADKPKSAPGDLELVRRFVNTLDVDEGSDAIASAPALEAWLRERGLLSGGAAARPQDVDRAVALREALRELLLRNNDGEPVDPEAVRTLDGAAGRAALRLRVGADGQTRLEPEGSGVDAALGQLLITVHRSMENGTWERLKACRNDTCRWAFYDHSKNRSGHWCSMAECGNRVKAREYRSRKRDAAAQG
jgi:predicted RNA-binding Zn ribbon-like protein